MNISKFKMGLTALCGFLNPANILHPLESAAINVVEYLIDVANAALAAIDPSKRATIAAAYNVTTRILATLKTLTWLVPTKWQSAYELLLQAVTVAANSLSDFRIEFAELMNVRDALSAAVTAWRAGDVPDTDVDFDGVGIDD